jgi:hypothetical protein
MANLTYHDGDSVIKRQGKINVDKGGIESGLYDRKEFL